MDPAADLYTPRAIRGSQLDREGLCPVCETPHWLRTRKSVYWCVHILSLRSIERPGANHTYGPRVSRSHMQFVHGIDSQTRQPYPPPSLYGLIGTEHVRL